ncbi:MAG: formate/nitrite transporter family protein, partial [Ardenticatenia bacterium]
MDYVTPQDLLNNILSAAEKKAHLSIKDMVVRGALSGALLGYATSLAFQVTTQGLPPIVGALLFPVGFVLLVLLGLELATGNFALLFKGLLAKRLDSTQMVRNWVWVYVGNLLGCLFYAL